MPQQRYQSVDKDGEDRRFKENEVVMSKITIRAWVAATVLLVGKII